MGSNGKDFVVQVLADTAKALTEMEGFADKVGTIALTLGAAWTAANIGGQFAEALSSGFDNQEIQNVLKAQLGSGDVAHDAGAAAGELYSQGLSGSLGDINEAVRAVATNLGSVDELGADAFQDVTRNAFNLSQVMDEDVTRTTAAAAAMIRSGLAPDAQAAFDIIAKGAETGTNRAGDLLDTFEEYSIQFAQLGLSSEQSLGLMNQGLAAGARNADIVADALKEFGIRAQEAMTNGVKAADVTAAQQALVTSSRAAADAETNLSHTQRDQRQAQLDLTQARRDAKAALADLADQVVGAGLSERAAELAVQRADANRNSAMAATGANYDPLAQDEAQLAYEQAVFNLQEQRERTRDLKNEKAAADKAGIDGSSQVISAQQQVVDANDKVRDAHRQIAQAARDQQAAQTQLVAATTPKLTTMGAAYAALGLDGEKVGDMVAQGGKAAQGALQLVLDGLRGVEDPAKRAQLAVQIFGTKAEDMQGALYALDPSTAVDGLGEVAGAADKVSDAVGEGVNSQITTFQNKINDWKNKLLELPGASSEATAAIVAFGGPIATTAGAIGPLIGGLISMRAAQALGTAATVPAIAANTGLAASFGAMTLAAAPWILGIAAIAAGAYLIYKNWDSIAGFFGDTWDAIGTGIDWIGDKLGDFFGFIVSMPKRLLNVYIGIANAWIWLFNAIIGGYNALDFGIHVHLPGWLGGAGFDVDDLIPDVNVRIPSIPALAGGGITSGPMLAWIGDNPGGREVVAPLDDFERMVDGGRGGDVIVVQVNGRELARAYRDTSAGEEF